jgi:hypothetical protein
MHDNEGAALSRRQLVGGVGLGIVAAAGPAFAQPQIQPTNSEPIMICQSACDLISWRPRHFSLATSCFAMGAYR